MTNDNKRGGCLITGLKWLIAIIFAPLVFPIALILFFVWRNKEGKEKQFETAKRFLIVSGVVCILSIIIAETTEPTETKDQSEQTTTEVVETETTEEETRETEESSKVEETEGSEESEEETETSDEDAEADETSFSYDEREIYEKGKEADWNSQITWEEMMRDDEYAYTAVEVSGEVITKLNQGEQEYIQIIMNGDPSQPVIVSNYDKYLDKNVLEGDNITAQGTFSERMVYENAFGQQKEAPLIMGDYIYINE